MAAEHLRALIARRAPGLHVTSLEEAAGVNEGWLSNHLRAKKTMPSRERLVEIARVIGHGCTPAEVSVAVFRDVYPQLVDDAPNSLSSGERDLLAAYWRVPEADRPRAIRMVELLGGDNE